MLSDQEIANILTQEKGTMNACKKLVEAANRMGGRDNITVLLLDVKEKEAEEEPVTVPEDLKAGINTKNVIFAFVVILLCSIAAYSFYKPNVPGKRTAQVPKQATIVYPLYLGKDTIIDASSLSKEKVDSFVISRAPIYGTISEKSKNSFKYHPIKNNLKKDDSIDIYLYNADIASVAHVIFRFEEEPFDYSTLSNPSDTLFIGAFKDSVYNDSLIQHRLYGFDEDSVSTLQILKENHDSSSLNHKISDSQSTGEKRKPDEPFSTETKKAKGDGSSL